MECAWVVLSTVTCTALQCFYTLSRKRHDFRKKNAIKHKMCVLIFSTFLWNIFHSKKNRDRYHENVYWSSCKVHFILSDFSETWILWTDFRKKFQIRNFMKNRPVWRRWGRYISCGRTDTMKLIFAFLNSANSPKNHSLKSKYGKAVSIEIHTEHFVR